MGWENRLFRFHLAGSLILFGRISVFFNQGAVLSRDRSLELWDSRVKRLEYLIGKFRQTTNLSSSRSTSPLAKVAVGSVKPTKLTLGSWTCRLAKPTYLGLAIEFKHIYPPLPDPGGCAKKTKRDPHSTILPFDLETRYVRYPAPLETTNNISKYPTTKFQYDS